MPDAIDKEKIIMVSSAGNNSTNASDYFSGNAPGIINVGALDHKGHPSSFSNWGPAIDLLAPGENIKFNYPNFTKTAAGTFLGTAFVAGTIGLMKAINPLISWKDACYYLTGSASSLPCEDYCAEESDRLIGCHDLCCQKSCAALALDAAETLRRLKSAPITQGLLEIDRSYLVFTRNFSSSQKIAVHNLGAKETDVEITSYDNNLIANSSQFSYTLINL
ncbi:MAG: Alkaline protease precursor [bacterium ADurb.BinA186]|nr:MAG: Alkaline protease precursor [bacterium ADurb.BinA186]